MKRKFDTHLRVLTAQVERLENQGHLEPGQASEAKKALRRMKRAQSGKKILKPREAQRRFIEAATDFIRLFTDKDHKQ